MKPFQQLSDFIMQQRKLQICLPLLAGSLVICSPTSIAGPSHLFLHLSGWFASARSAQEPLINLIMFSRFIVGLLYCAWTAWSRSSLWPPFHCFLKAFRSVLFVLCTKTTIQRAVLCSLEPFAIQATRIGRSPFGRCSRRRASSLPNRPPTSKPRLVRVLHQFQPDSVEGRRIIRSSLPGESLWALNCARQRPLDRPT